MVEFKVEEIRRSALDVLTFCGVGNNLAHLDSLSLSFGLYMSTLVYGLLYCIELTDYIVAPFKMVRIRNH